MPEPLLLVQAIGLAAGLAGIVQLLVWWIVGVSGPVVLSKNPEQQQRRGAAGGALGVGIGFVAGAGALGQWPHWPPVEDRDRFLAVLLPTAIFIECLAALLLPRRWLAWGMRLVLSAATAPILLYATTYLTELAGPGSREWTNRQTAAWLMGMAAALAVVWMTAIRLLRTNSGRILPFALAITAAGAGVTIMLSGYLTGGELALPLAGTIGGAAFAALGLRMPRCNEGALSIGIVGLFSVLVMGRFFGELTTLHGGILLAAPLLVCLPDLMPRNRLSPWLQGVLASAVVLISIAFVVMQAREKFVQSSAPASSSGEATARDYLEYR